MEFNDKLMQLRKEKGWSQEELGIKINVTRQTISKWELKETTPEMKKLVELSQIFDVSIDSLVGNKSNDIPSQKVVHHYSFGCAPYEYISKIKIFNLPLVHINVGNGRASKAKGIIAIGNYAYGLITIGLFCFGGISIGILPIGLISLGCLSIGLLLSIGALAIGTVSIGGISIGIFATGGLAIGFYALGGACFAKNIGVGGYVQAAIAIADIPTGDITFNTNNVIKFNEVQSAINQNLPDTPKFICDFFAKIAELSSMSNYR